MFNVMDQYISDDFSLYLGDSCEVLQNFADESFDLSVYSPPFQSLFTYSPTERDLGNSKTRDDFFNHYSFIIKEIFRVTKTGRVTAVHVSDLTTTLVHDGYIGMKDFSGDVIRAYINAGWRFDGRIPIDKNQQAIAIRTHSKHLLMPQMEKDRSWLSPALPDYILKFRKPGENKVPVAGGFTGDAWIEYANPTWPENDWTSRVAHFETWVNHLERLMDDDFKRSSVANVILEMRKILECKHEACFDPFDGVDRINDVGAHETWFGIREPEVIQGAFDGRDEKDERHIAPLQLETIRRCIELWSNPGEVILDPFSGVGSTAYVAVKNKRKAVGIELKESWYRQAIKNVNRLYMPKNMTLF